MSASAYAAAAAPVAKDEFPWKYELGVEEMEWVDEEYPFKLDGFPYQMEDAMNQEDEWPYFYARPMHESLVPSYEHDPNTRLLRMMNPTQRLFVEFYAPNNVPKLHAFFQLTRERRVQLGVAIFEASDKTAMLPYPSQDVLAQLVKMPEGATFYQGHGAVIVQRVLKKHPSLSKANSLADTKSFFDKSNEQDLTTAIYRDVFSHIEQSTAVPMPVGLVLFEGRPQFTYEERIVNGQSRREVFSVSWHPDAALKFLHSRGNVDVSYSEMSRSRKTVLVVHKVMSSGILGFDAQEYVSRAKKDDLSHDHPKPIMYAECEIMVQPFVKIHEVDDNVHLFHQGNIAHVHYAKRIQQKVAFVRTIFTHLYLGDKCLCGHTEA